MKDLRFGFVLVSLSAILAVAPVGSNAQTTKGILAGVARDASGAVLPKATITITNQDTAETRTVESRPDGTYRVDAISPGAYMIVVSAPGFETTTIKDLMVNASVVTSYDPVLTVGKVTTEVTIEASANTINTQNGSLSGTIGMTEIRNVPIFSLNPIELATTVPGVQVVGNGAGGNSNGQNIQVNGLRPRDNNFLIDGQDINDNSIQGQAIQPNIPDIFSEVTVLTNSSSAEFGRGGGAVVNLVTRSGTNRFHGSAWELYSGSGLSALNGQQRQVKPLPPGSPNPKVRANTHRYGFTIGGPIIKNRLFAFGGSQWSRTYGKEIPSRLTVPDANGLAILNRIGGARVTLLEQYLNGLVGTDPSSGPVGSQDVSRPSCPSCVVTYGYYTRPAPSQQNTNTQWTYKVDLNLTQKDTFAFRYLHARNLLTPDFFNFPASLPGLDTNQGGPSEQFGATYTHVFTSNLLNEFRASETRIDFRFNITPEALKNPLFPLPSLTVDKLPLLGISSGIPQGRGHDIYQFQDTVAYTHGRHTLRLGADVGRLIVRDFIPFNSRGTITYAAGGSTSILANFIDDYSGVNGPASIVYGNNRVDAHVWQTGFFGQDDFKVTRDLTLNLGLRYEYNSNPANSLQYPGINVATALTDPFNAVIKVKEDRNNFAPRFGFAYAPHSVGNRFVGNGKTVVRGGFGVFYDVVFTNITDNSQAASPNANASTLQSPSGRGIANVSTAIYAPNLALPSNSVTSVDSNQVNPYTYQYNLGVEQELPANMKLSMFYVGTRGLKVFAQRQFNYSVNGVKLNPARGLISARGNYADSNYNSLQINVDHNFSHGVFVRGAYTFGKALDNATDVFVQFDTNTVYPANLSPGGIRNEWSRSAFDHRHFLSMIYVWQIPGVHTGFLSAITNHWTVSGVSQFQSGQAGSAGISSFDTNLDGQFNDRPGLGSASASIYTLGQDGTYVQPTTCNGVTTKYTPGVIYDLTAVQSCTKTGPGYVTAFQAVAPTSVHWIIAPGSGNIRRNTISAPGLILNNIAVQKDVPLSFIHRLEGHALQFRVEAQNIANHNNVRPYNTLVNNLVGSQINGTSFVNKSFSRDTDARNIRLWAKYQF